ncbi:MAG: SDR family oxidoreductase [Marmoricola sp.]
MSVPDQHAAHRTALVTGASSGIGRAVASVLLDRGYEVLGTSRRPDAVADPLRGVTWLPLDLTDEASIRNCARAAGDVEVLVNNAGESQSGPFEELPREALDRLFALNVLGQVQLTQLLLPGMRQRGRGRVIMVSSMLASFPLAFRSSYVATKAALEGFAFSLRGEVEPFGIGVSVVEPGSIATGIPARRTEYVGADSPYRASYDTMLGHLNANEAAGIPPDQVARTVLAAIESAAPKPLYAVGSNAPVVFPLRRLLPLHRTLRMVARRHGL